MHVSRPTRLVSCDHAVGPPQRTLAGERISMGERALRFIHQRSIELAVHRQPQRASATNHQHREADTIPKQRPNDLLCRNSDSEAKNEEQGCHAQRRPAVVHVSCPQVIAPLSLDSQAAVRTTFMHAEKSLVELGLTTTRTLQLQGSPDEDFEFRSRRTRLRFTLEFCLWRLFRRGIFHQ